MRGHITGRDLIKALDDYIEYAEKTGAASDMVFYKELKHALSDYPCSRCGVYGELPICGTCWNDVDGIDSGEGRD